MDKINNAKWALVHLANWNDEPGPITIYEIKDEDPEFPILDKIFGSAIALELATGHSIKNDSGYFFLQWIDELNSPDDISKELTKDLKLRIGHEDFTIDEWNKIMDKI